MASLNTVAVIWQTGKVLTYLVVWQVHSLLYVSTSLATHDANEKLHMYFQDYESQGTIVFLDNFVIPEIGNCKSASAGSRIVPAIHREDWSLELALLN